MLSKIATPGCLLAALLLTVGLAACQKENPATDEKLDKILARLDTLEKKIDQGGGRAGAAGQGQPRPQPAAPDPQATYSVPIEGNPVKGPATAKITLVSAEDFACPFCRRSGPTIAQLEKDYGNNLRYVWKDMVVHPQIAMTPALAACAAQQQGKFFEFEEGIWNSAWELEPQPHMKDPKLLSQESMEKLATDMHLDMAKFKADMAGDKCKTLINTDMQQLSQVGVRGTPAFYINGRYISGAQPIESFKVVIDEEMKKADAAIAGGVKPEDYYATAVVAKGKKALDPPKPVPGQPGMPPGVQVVPTGAPGQPVRPGQPGGPPVIGPRPGAPAAAPPGK